MDPKSLASNTAALLALTIQVNGALYGNWDDDSRPVAERLLYELARLRAHLTALEEASLRNEDPIILGELPHLFKALKATLVYLGSKLLGNGDTRDIPSQNNLVMTWESFIQGDKPPNLPINRREGERIFNEFQTHTARLRLAYPRSLAITTSEELGDSTQFAPLQERSKLWNDCAKYNDIHANSQKIRVDGCGVWLLSHPAFRKWMENDMLDTTRQEHVLYCHGRPGSGKTILASKVVDELNSPGRTATVGLAYFYFSYRDQIPIYNVTLALLQQLYIQSSAPEIQELEIEYVQTASKPTLTKLIRVLMSVTARFRKVYIVLDALDECSNDNERDLANLVASIRSSHARLFVTTRPSHNIPDLDICPLIAVEPHEEDMELFVKERLGKISRKHDAFTASQESKVVTELVRKGCQHGMFLLVELQITGLLKLFERELWKDSDLDDALGNLRGDLTEIYDAQIGRIMGQQAGESNLARHIISWLYYSTGSMSTDKLKHVLRWQVHEWDEKPDGRLDTGLIHKVCFDLVRLSQDSKATTFFHFSFHEYLEKQQELGYARLPMSATLLAEACLKYLLQDELASPVSSPEKINQRLRDFPFYEYAAHNWGKLLCQGGAVDFEFAPLKSLLTDTSRKLAVAEVIFRDEPRFFAATDADRFGTLHFITHFGLMQPKTALPNYAGKWEVDRRDFMARTPFHIASMMGHSSALEVLFSITDPQPCGTHAALMSLDALGQSALHLAAAENHSSVAEILVQKLLTLEGEIQPSQLATKDHKGATPLSYAAAGGNLSVLHLLLRNGVYATDIEDALQAAIRGGHARAVDILLRHGKAPTYKHLMMAIDYGAESVVRLLLEYGVDIESEGPENALIKAAEAGKNPILSSLIWNGANLERTDNASQTPLSIAVKKRDVYAVKSLLEAGSNPEVEVVDTTAAEAQACRAAPWTAAHGLLDIFRLLRYAGADCSSSFFPAVEEGHYEVVRDILESKVVPELDERLRAQAISTATERGHTKVALLLQNWNTQDQSVVKSHENTQQETTQESSHPEDIWNKVGEPKLIALADAAADNVDDIQSVLSVSSRDRSDEIEEIASTWDSAGSKGIPVFGDFKGSMISADGSMMAGPAVVADSRPSSNPQLPQVRRGWVRVSTKPQEVSTKVSRAPFILLDSPISSGRIHLGSLVRSPNKPLDSHLSLPQDAFEGLIPERFVQVINQNDFQMESAKNNKSSAGLSVSVGVASVGAQTSRARGSEVRMKAPHVSRHQLIQHERALESILNRNSEHSRDFIEFIRQGKKAYMVVGLFVMKDSMVAIGDDSDNELVQASVAGGIPGFEINPGSAARKQTMVSTVYKKPLVHAIQYRSVKVRTAVRDLFRSVERRRELHLELGGYEGGSDYISIF